MSDKKKVTIIFGGQSSEHEVSRFSAESVLRNIDKDKYDVKIIGITKSGKWLPYDGPLELIGTGKWQEAAENNTAKLYAGCAEQIAKNCTPVVNSLDIAIIDNENDKVDVVFPVLHGCNGEDGTIQGLLELAGIPYVGCGVLGSAIGMDKGYAKIVFEKEGIPQGKYLVFTRKQVQNEKEEIINKVESTLTYPCFVKPSNAGSSVGVNKAHDRQELIYALDYAAKYDRRVLVEEFINGREIECAVLGNDNPEASVVGEVIPCNEFYDFNAKYNSGDSSEVIIPANLPEEVSQSIRGYAVRAFKALDLSGLARVDFFLDKITNEIYINEVNTMPGFTSISMYPKLWEATGLPYGKLIERLIELAIERFEQSKREI